MTSSCEIINSSTWAKLWASRSRGARGRLMETEWYHWADFFHIRIVWNVYFNAVTLFAFTAFLSLLDKVDDDDDDDDDGLLLPIELNSATKNRRWSLTLSPSLSQLAPIQATKIFSVVKRPVLNLAETASARASSPNLQGSSGGAGMCKQIGGGLITGGNFQTLPKSSISRNASRENCSWKFSSRKWTCFTDRDCRCRRHHRRRWRRLLRRRCWCHSAKTSTKWTKPLPGWISSFFVEKRKK